MNHYAAVPFDDLLHPNSLGIRSRAHSASSNVANLLHGFGRLVISTGRCGLPELNQ
jgi:hypothetical protein